MKINEYKEEDYTIIYGVEKLTFDTMVRIAELKYNEVHKKGGRKDGVTPKQRVEITLKYNRQYMSQRYLALEYGIAKSCISPIVKWVMKNVVSNPLFSLFNRVQNINDNSEDRLIDVTETTIDRPSKNQRKWYSGKKKRHTAKTQVEVGSDTLLIYSISFASGSTHDYKLYKKSKIDYNSNSTIFVDMGYIGIKKRHKNSIIPIRSSKNHRLNKYEKWWNKEVSKIRIAVEHVNAFIKKFKVVGTRFRNRRKNFKLFMTFITI